MEVNEKTRLADIVRSDAATLPLLMRFGFYPGYGTLRVGDACQDKGVDLCLFLRVVRAAVNSGEESALETEGDTDLPPIGDKGQLVEFLRRSNQWYRDMQLPTIARHFELLLKRSGEETSRGLEALKNFYNQLAVDLAERERFDNERLFPMLRVNDPDSSVAEMRGESQELDQRLEDEADDLLAFLIIHLQGATDPNLLTAVVWSVENLRDDLRRNRAIRRVLDLKGGNIRGIGKDRISPEIEEEG